ncbi:MAG: multicopper oxidase family protein, partial [Nakamurella sp.]
MKISRRNFFGIAGSAGLVAATASLGWIKSGPTTSTGISLRSEVPLPPAFSRSLTIPSVVRPTAGGFELPPRVTSTEIIPGLPTEIWGFNGSFPGPTIVGAAGQPMT